MNFFQYMAEHGHEQLIFSHNQKVGLRVTDAFRTMSRFNLRFSTCRATFNC